MTVDETVPADTLKTLYQADYFAGREYIDYVGDKPAHQKTLARHLDLVRRFVPSGSCILEIGCAYGFFLELVQKEYPGSVGVDICAAGVAHARQNGLDAREGNLLTMSFEKQFGGVCLWDTIEHLPNPLEVLQRAAQWLAPGGLLFLTTGDFGALVPRLRGLNWRQIHPPTHLYYFTRRSLQQLCRRVGLETVHFGTVTVHRRLGSVLRAMAQGKRDRLSGHVAATSLRVLPDMFLQWSFPLNLGDTLSLVASKPMSPTQVANHEFC